MKKFLRIIGVALLVLVLAMPFACTKKEEKETKTKEKKIETTTKKSKTESEKEKKDAKFEVTSSAFDNDADIPTKYAYSDAGGENISIPLEWKNPPEDTKSFAISMVDTNPDAGNFLHWLVINILPDISSVEEGASGKNMPPDATEFKNNYGQDGYGGPAPPPGSEHDYVITVYALSIPSMSMSENAGLSQFESFTKDKVLGRAIITGEFSR